jgi:hypothetical protein
LTAALAAMGVTAFGSDPRWVAYRHGMELILLSRRLEAPLIALTLASCAAVCGMVVAGRWRAWWLIGLAPILALFVHHFALDPARAMQVDADAQFVAADQATQIADTDFVVGLNFDGESYAYPYNILFQNPIVAQAKPHRRLLLFWSAYANRAYAAEADWTVKPRDLQVVSEPANSLLVYNSELGEFINGVTGLTSDGHRPQGFTGQLPTSKMTWKSWRTLHPDTFVLRPPPGWIAGSPTLPVAPRYPMPGMRPDQAPGTTTVALIDAPRPMLVKESDVTTAPLNMLVDRNPLLLFHDGGGAIKAYLRQANGDLTPRYFPVSIVNHPNFAFTEHDSNTLWAADGRALDGPLKGEKLKPFDVDEQVYLDVIRFWYPQAVLLAPQPSDIGLPPPAPASTAHRPGARRARLRHPAAPAVPVRTVKLSF